MSFARAGTADDGVGRAGQAAADTAECGTDHAADAAGRGNRVHRWLVPDRAQHRDALTVLHYQHGDRERNDEFDRRRQRPGRCL